MEDTITIPLMWDKDAEISSISLDGYGCQIQKVSRCRPVVSNETILATRQEILFTKVSSMQSITHIVLLEVWLMLLSRMFTSSYITIYFFINIFIFSNVYISVNTIFECRSLLSRLTFTHTVSCWSCNYEIVEQ